MIKARPKLCGIARASFAAGTYDPARRARPDQELFDGITRPHRLAHAACDRDAYFHALRVQCKVVDPVSGAIWPVTHRPIIRLLGPERGDAR